MRRRWVLVVLIVVAAASLGSYALASPGQASKASSKRDGPLPNRYVDRVSGVTVRYPAGWRVDQRALTSLLSPRQLFVISSFPIRQRRSDPNCTPRTAIKELPPTGALLFLLGDRSERRGSLGRPAHFHLERLAPQPHECFGVSRQIDFLSAGRDIYVLAYFGPKVSFHTENLVDRVLDSLKLQTPGDGQNPPG